MAVIRSVRTLHEGWCRLVAAEIEREGTTFVREIEDHGRAVAVLPYDPARRVALLARQLRPPTLLAEGLTGLLEAPAGLLDEGDPADCARREALEEVGLRLSALEPLGQVWSMPGLSTERMDLFLAPYAAADRTGTGGGLAAEHEAIEVVEVPLAELARLSETGGIEDAKTLILVLSLRLRRPELFAG